MRRCGRCEGWVAVPCISTVSSQRMGTRKGLSYVFGCAACSIYVYKGQAKRAEGCWISETSMRYFPGTLLFSMEPSPLSLLTNPMRLFDCLQRIHTPEPEFASAWYTDLLYYCMWENKRIYGFPGQDVMQYIQSVR